MAYDEHLATRVRDRLIGEALYSERKMFGGLCFMIGGHMACGILGERLMVRVDNAKYEALLALPHAAEMDFNGKPMRGFLFIHPDGLIKEADFQSWVDRGTAYARRLPPKAPKVQKPRKASKAKGSTGT
jgi:hypothetical protein